MYRLTVFELSKVWGKKIFWTILTVLLVLNLFLLWYTTDVKGNISPQSYHMLMNDLQTKTEREKEVFLNAQYEKATAYRIIEQVKSIEAEQGDASSLIIETLKQEHPGFYEKYINNYNPKEKPLYTQNYSLEEAFFSEILKEYQLVSSYPEFLAEINEKAQNLLQISIFKTNNHNIFSERNIQKTKHDFETIKEVSIRYDTSKGFMTATGFILTDILLIGALFVIASVLIYDEKKKDMFSVLRPTPRGRNNLIFSKIAAMGISALAVTILLFAVNFIWCASVFGLGDLSRSLQSNGAFMGSILPLSTGQYIGVYLLVKWAGAFLSGLFILLITLLFQQQVFALFSISTLYGFSFLLYTLIPPLSNYNWIKYINPSAILRTNELFTHYLNFNLFQHPVNMIPVLEIFFILMIAILLSTLLLVFIKKKNFRSGHTLGIFTSKNFRVPIGSSLFSHELYKLLFGNKALLFILLFLALMWSNIQSKPPYQSSQEIIYRSYMQTLHGDMNAEKQAYIEQEQKALDHAQKQVETINAMKFAGEITPPEASELMAPYEIILQKREIFDQVLMRIDYVNSNKDAKFLYDLGYQKLLLSGVTVPQTLCFVLTLILCFSSFFSSEFKNNEIRILQTTPLGRNATAWLKLKICILFSTLLGILYVIPQIAFVGKNYGFAGLFFPALSLPSYNHLPSFIPILGVIIFHFIIQILCGIGISIILCGLSLKLKNNIFTLLISTLIFLVPILLYGMGLHFIKPSSILPLLEMGKNISNTKSLLFLPICILFILLTIILFTYTILNFGQKQRVTWKKE